MIQQQGKVCNMRKPLSTILLVVILITGLSLLLYPTVSNAWNASLQTSKIDSYVKSVVDLQNDDYKEMLQAAHAYNERLYKEKHILALSDSERAEYESMLAVGTDGTMGYIEIPKIRCVLPIYHGTNEAVLQSAIGHIEGSSLPVGGANTHCVLSGHRGLPSAKLFSNLDQLETGDTFELHILDETLTYEVDQIRIVLPEEVDDLTPQEGKDLCTLVTCTPYGVNTHRLLVRGHRVENAAAGINVRVPMDAVQVDPIMVAPIVAVPILLLLLILLFCGGGRRTKKKEKHA